MKKNYVRLFALLICAVMVLGMLPANANALTLDGRQMPKHNAIDYNADYGIHYFTEFADLVEIARAAAADPDNWYYAVCENETGMTITSSLTIPENLTVDFQGDVAIPAGVSVDLNGQLYCNNLDIQGTVTVGLFSDDDNYDNDVWGYFNPWGNVNIEGAVYVNCGAICFNIHSTVIGEGNIHLADNGNANIEVDAFIQTEADLVEAVDIAASESGNKHYYFYVRTKDLHITNPVTIPQTATLSVSYPDAVLSGAPITVYGYVSFNAYSGDIVIENDLIIAQAASAEFYSEVGNDYCITLKGDVTNGGYISVLAPVVFTGNVVNHRQIHIHYNYNGSISFASPDLYDDSQTEDSFIHLYHNATYYPEDAIVGLNMDNFEVFENEPQSWNNMWILSGYQNSGSSEPPAHEHTVVTVPAKVPTCLDNGYTEGAYCSECNEVLVEAEKLAPLGHDYGLGEDGKPDFWDTDCDVCGAERVVDPHRPTHSMYRMYNPNTGEHFYTGSMEERLMLENAGWKFEGVAFTFTASVGAPVYRLFDPSTGEHLYTMDEAEKAALLAAGWNDEGVAFNSNDRMEVAQYRLHNPNESVGAYHFTASQEERNNLLAAGWEDQGIGFYTCLQ